MKIYIQARGSYETLRNLSTWAEQNEIERIGLPDHYIVGKQRHDKDNPTPALDLLTASAGLVRDTEKMIYSILVSPITFRHPSVLVKMASTINEMAPNRFRLGVGTGWLEIEHELFGIPFPDLKTRFKMLEESLIYIREALSGGNQGFKGEYYQLEKFPVEPATLSEIPIIIGGGGKVKTPTLAGKYSEEFNIYAGPKETLQNSINLFKTVASENGRDEKAEHVLVKKSNEIIAYARVLEDIDHMIEFCENQNSAKNSSIGLVGYCMSGPFAFYAAGKLPEKVAAAASIHGVKLVTESEDSPHLFINSVKGELYFGCAETDSYAPLEMINALEKHLSATSVDYKIEIFPKTHHGFAFPNRGQLYSRVHAETHWFRILDLFSRKLK